MIFGLIALVAYVVQNDSAPASSDRFEGKELQAPATLREGYVPVLRVVDGDTLKVRYDGKTESLRLIGIDTAEIANEHKGTGNQPGSVEASRFLEDLVDDDPQIRIEFDVDKRDKYDRLLGYAWAFRNGNEVMLNEELVRAGHAKPKYYTPNGKYRTRLEAAAR